MIRVRSDLDVAPPERRILVCSVGVGVANEPTVPLEHANVPLDVDRRGRQPAAEIVRGHVRLRDRGELVGVH